MPIIEYTADKESVIFSDGFKSYDGIVDYGYKEHFRVKHSECFADGNNHINCSSLNQILHIIFI